MTGEPMTDVDRIRAQWVADLRARIAANKNCKFVQVSSLQLACLFKELDETAAERDRHANAYVELHGQHVTRMLELADARSALKRAEAARDAALARAMPEARLIQTKDEAAQLPAGTYYVSPVEAGEGWFAVEALDRFSGPRWLYLDQENLRGDHMIAGCFVIRLPDLPIPPAPATTEE